MSSRRSVRPAVSAGERTQVLDALRRIIRALRLSAGQTGRRTGMSTAQLFVLQQLADAPASSLNELAARTHTHQSSVSVVVRRLVERGLVSRTPSSADKRRIEIAVTPSGRALLADAPVTVSMELMGALHRMARDDRETLADLLERWLKDANIDFASPPMMGEEEDAVRA